MTRTHDHTHKISAGKQVTTTIATVAAGASPTVRVASATCAGADTICPHA